MKRLYFIFLFLICLVAPSFSIISGARPISMGEAFTGLADDINAIYYNPAGLAFTKGDHFQGTTYPVPLDDTFNVSSYALTFDSPFGRSGVSLIKENLILDTGFGDKDYFTSEQVTFAFSSLLTDNIAVGFKANQFYSAYETNVVNDAHGASGDFGVLYKVDDSFSLGAMLEAFTSTDISGNLGNPQKIPRILRIGMGYVLSDGIKLTMETQKNTDVDRMNWSNQYGMEYKLDRQLTVRGGLYNFSDSNHTSISSFGITLNIMTWLQLDAVRINQSNYLTDMYSVRCKI